MPSRKMEGIKDILVKYYKCCISIEVLNCRAGPHNRRISNLKRVPEMSQFHKLFEEYFHVTFGQSNVPKSLKIES